MNKQLGVALLLAVLSSGVLAKWEELGNDSENNFTTYVDPNTLRKSGTTVKMWHLMDYKKVQLPASKDAHSSKKIQTEYDCSAEKTRILYLAYHMKKMGAGTISYSDDLGGNWGPVPPESVKETLWKYACGVQ